MELTSKDVRGAFCRYDGISRRSQLGCGGGMDHQQEKIDG